MEKIEGAATNMDITDAGQGLRIAHLRNLKPGVTSPGAASSTPKVVERAI